MDYDLPQGVVARFKQKPHHFLRGVVRALAPERALLGVFAQMTGSHVAAAALDHSLMWQMVVERNPARDDGWWWKSDAEWERELLIGKRQMMNVRRGLAAACVEMGKRSRESAPQATWHYRVAWLGFFEALAVALNTSSAKIFAIIGEMVQSEDAQREASAAALIAQIPQVTKQHLYADQNSAYTSAEMSQTLTSYTSPDSSSGVYESESPPSDARARALDGFSDPSWKSGEGNFGARGTQTPPPVPPTPSPMTAHELLAMDMHRDTNLEMSLSDCRALIAGYGEEVCIAALRELRRQPYGIVRNRAGWLRSKIEFSTKPFEDAVRRLDKSGQLSSGLPW
jgi:hypothetical protein